MLREEQLLASAIREHLDRANTARHTKYLIEAGHRTMEDVEANSEEWAIADQTLSHHVKQSFLLTLILAEQLRLPLLRRELARRRDAFEGKMSSTEPSIWDTVSECPAHECVKSYYTQSRQ